MTLNNYDIKQINVFQYRSNVYLMHFLFKKNLIIRMSKYQTKSHDKNDDLSKSSTTIISVENNFCWLTYWNRIIFKLNKGNYKMYINVKSGNMKQYFLNMYKNTDKIITRKEQVPKHVFISQWNMQ